MDHSNLLTEHNYQCQDHFRQTIHDALKKEYNEVQKDFGTNRVTLYNGTFHHLDNDRYIYKFAVTPLMLKELEEDSPCMISIKNRNVKGDILISGESKTVTVYLEEDFGEKIPYLDIRYDLSFLIDLLDQRIVKIDMSPLQYNTELSSQLFSGLQFPNLKELKFRCDHIKRKDEKPLDNNQLEAIKKTLQKPFTIIWGPPGTGKTHTLLGVLAELITYGKRVLFSSNTNAAIDNVLEKIIHHCPYTVFPDFIQENKIVRIGSRIDNKEVEEWFSPRKIAERKSKNLKKEKSDILQKVKEIKKYIEQILDIQQWKVSEKVVAKYKQLDEDTADFPEKGHLELQYSRIKKSLIQYLKIKNEQSPTLCQEVSTSLLIYRELLKNRDILASVAKIVVNKESHINNSQKIQNRLKIDLNKVGSNLFKKIFNTKRISNIKALLKKEILNEQQLLTQLNALKKQIYSYSQQEIQHTVKIRKSLKSLEGLTNVILELFHIIEPYVKNHPSIESKTLDMFKEKELMPDSVTTELLKINHLTLPFLFHIWEEHSNPDIIEKSMQADMEKLSTKLKKLKQHADMKQEYITAHEFLRLNSAKKEVVDKKCNEISTLEIKIDSIDADLDEMEIKLINNAQLISATMVKSSYDEILAKLSFDALVVDEYSMVNLPQIYCVSSIIKERVVLCGDHLQLSPICKSKEKILEQNFYEYHEGEFQVRREREIKGATVLRPFIVELSRQRRMPPDISALIRNWYLREGNQLIDDWQNNKEISIGSIPLKENNIVILDSSGANAYSKKTASGSYINLIHSGIACELCRQIIKESDLNPESIRYISPYRGQVDLTRIVSRQLLGIKDSEIMEANINTIHKSQGKGASIVIYDLTDGKNRLSIFHKKKAPNLLNVALTRAESKLIIICHYSKILENLNQLGHQTPLLEVFKKMQQYGIPVVPAEKFVQKVFQKIDLQDLATLQDDVKSKHERNPTIEVLQEKVFNEALKKDLNERARKNVLFVLSKMTYNKFIQFRTQINNLRERGITVRVITHSPTNKSGQSDPNLNIIILDQLVKLEAEVILASKIQGNLIAIDKSQFYWNSGSFFAFNETRNTWVRFISKHIYKQLSNLIVNGKTYPYKKSNMRITTLQLIADLRKNARSELKQFRYILAARYHRPMMSFLWNDTIEKMLESPPRSKEEYLQIKEFSRNNCKLLNHLEEISEFLLPIRIEMAKSSKNSKV